MASEKQDISGFDTSEDAKVGHWRGFSKYLQPDDRVVAIGSRDENGKALVLGPCRNVRACDELITKFYQET